MGLGCGGSCMKVLLIIFNIIFFLGGAAILGIGIWLYVDPSASRLFGDLLPESSDPLWKGATILLMTVGAATFVVGFFGCCGACREDPCMLATYGSLLVIILTCEVVAGILAAVFRNDIKDELRATMLKQIPEVVQNPKEGGTINQAWHFMQYELQCCGAGGPYDYNTSANFDTMDPVPLTCCVLNNKDFENPEVKDKDACFQRVNPNYIHTKGCYNALLDFLDSKSIILIGVGVAIGLLQIIGIIFAFCLCKEVKNSDATY